MAQAKELGLNFAKDRETKNTVRYAEVSDDPIVGTLYVKKTAAADIGNPEKLAVVIQPAD